MRHDMSSNFDSLSWLTQCRSEGYLHCIVTDKAVVAIQTDDAVWNPDPVYLKGVGQPGQNPDPLSRSTRAFHLIASAATAYIPVTGLATVARAVTGMYAGYNRS